ncbi:MULTISPECIES: Panacea domain-containing protein [Tetragenococcus]|mgnify:CR=1 FL=1|uniref:Antitoxin SocA-like Panacea domain-containing protein n=1 Tax=Tetragenococcus muriaticus 3MR10-3 TaxID=1302648 RepID=A0A091CDJ4_9ENTE|nr:MULTISPECIES: type II toxin-antitoxin system antitoxin SocA domain-containing protein [Tetragenococcus]KFN92188.1 hypothetical protein TMU3MR103_0649 [Tetragenococcus muriaticus 3MR10-3]GBD74262.1 hypothetical protein TEHN7125_2422 [Tetragenococcus halophilus subsp. halophilus]GBD76494.1 hypothetical protein TEHN7126_2193 [Tetragenococcus halophilus subsp. halophilus]GMQ73497.1 hypothetical protein TEHSL10_11310 [Tetragenococcus halophilus]
MANLTSVEKWFVKNNADVASSTLEGNYKLQKLLYYSQAMSLAVDNRPLFDEDFKGWEKGPVVSKAHYDYKVNRIAENNNEKDYEQTLADLSGEEEKVLSIVNFVYGTESAQDLIDQTHKEKPWNDLKEEALQRKNPIITKDSIKEFYQPLKEVYDSYKTQDLSHMKTRFINGNCFVFDSKETDIQSDDEVQLWDFGTQVQGDKFFVYKDESDLIVV